MLVMLLVHVQLLSRAVYVLHAAVQQQDVCNVAAIGFF